MSLKRSAIVGMLWTASDRFVTYFLQFFIGVLLARLLCPADYGIVGMVTIFMAVAGIFIDSGFSSALIQKKNCTEADYSTVFYFNLFISAIAYVVLYVSAPFIARFYHHDILCSVTRVVGLSLLIGALSSVQVARLTIQLRFKAQAVASVISVIFSGSIGILMAYRGFGVWALVFQGVAGTLTKTIVVWAASGWCPSLVFSTESFRKLFSFGSKLLGSGLINTVYQNLHALIIGRVFSAEALGLVNRGQNYASIIPVTVMNTIIKVSYPILSKMQDDNERLIYAYRRIALIPTFFLLPIMFGMAALAEQIIVIMLGERWLPCACIMQVFCIGYCIEPLSNINLNLLYVKGRSDLVLKMEIVKKFIGFMLLLCSVPFGVMGMCVSKVVYDFVACVFNCHYTKRLLGYGLKEQFADLSKTLINVMVMFAVVSAITRFVASPVYQLFLGIVCGALVFVLFAYLVKDQLFIWSLDMIRLKLRGK